jgi:hypothetical protein
MFAWRSKPPLRPKPSNMEQTKASSERRRICDCQQAQGCPKCNAAWAERVSSVPPSGSPADPFGCSKVTIDVQMHRFLLFFTVVWMPTAFRLDVQVNSPGQIQQRPASTSTDLIRGCMANEMHMYSLLAAATGRMKFVTGDTLDRSDRPEQYLAKAIITLRRYLEEGSTITQQVIVDMFFLATVEIYSRNFEGARAHLRIIKFLIDKLGGLRSLDQPVIDMVWNGDMVAACFLVAVPIFDSLPDPGPLPALRTAQIEADLTASARRPMGLAFLKLNHFFDLHMRAVVKEIVCVARTVQHFWQFSHARTSDREWAAERAHALIHRMLSTPASPELLDERALKQECCRIAFIMWLAYMYSIGTTGVPSLPINVQKVRKLLPGNATLLRRCVERADVALGKSWAPHEEVLLWVVSLGALTSFDQEDNAFFSQRVVQVAKKLKIRSYEQVDSLFESYLWLDRLEQGSGRKLARLVSHDSRDIIKELRLGDRRDSTTQLQFGALGLAIAQITKNVTEV